MIEVDFACDPFFYRQWIRTRKTLMKNPVVWKRIHGCAGGWRKQRDSAIEMVDFDPNLPRNCVPST